MWKGAGCGAAPNAETTLLPGRHGADVGELRAATAARAGGTVAALAR
jgi:hypothetical protein